MAPIKAGKYEYRPESLVSLRDRLGLTQTKMAKLLDIPANTLSRWENGVTTPDAASLASIHSLAVDRGITPNFFQRRRPVRKPSTVRSTLLATWDFQNLGATRNEVASLDSWIRGKLEEKFPSTSRRLFKAFASPYQEAATDELQGLGWRVWEDEEDIDDEIVNQAKSDCGQEPKGAILVLIANDGDYVELIDDLRRQGVLVYLITSQHQYSQDLIQAVGKKRWIRLDRPLSGLLPWLQPDLTYRPLVFPLLVLH